MNELIIVKQLPIIEEKLVNVKEMIEKKVADVLLYECTDETVKDIKKMRTELSKEFKNFETTRKLVKTQIQEPYVKFEKIYKECISNIYENADSQLKEKINNVENNIKNNKQKEIEKYFNELLISENIDFVTFENANINVTLTASKKSLLEQTKSFVDKIAKDIRLIETLDDKAEIFVEYKKTLDVSSSVLIVKHRKELIAQELEKEEEKSKIVEKEQQNIQKVDKVLQAPVEDVYTEQETIEKITFTIYDETVPRLKELKQFLINGGYKYE